MLLASAGRVAPYASGKSDPVPGRPLVSEDHLVRADASRLDRRRRPPPPPHSASPRRPAPRR
eukprot:6115498-Prymnesium_polylepis.1